ncbi:MAG: 30S ribosomal protein S9 [Candidatus Pacearchaeota archaeon]|nr:30S ribosomal protein S9 [Candidatus Pacearchaeota archaeon]
MKKSKQVVVAGKRKEAIAKATIKPGSGKILINKKPISLFNQLQQLALQEPIILAKPILGKELEGVNIEVNVKGGGIEGQVEASRLAIARAILSYFKKPELKKAFLSYDRFLLIADTRRKETRKPCDSKARARRQKSYR